jgi:hypothetical protein
VRERIIAARLGPPPRRDLGSGAKRRGERVDAMGLMDLFRKKGDGAPPPDLDQWIAKLSSPDAKVRVEACRKLQGYGARAAKATPKLQELIDDVDGDVCNAAAAALTDIERNLT